MVMGICCLDYYLNSFHRDASMARPYNETKKKRIKKSPTYFLSATPHMSSNMGKIVGTRPPLSSDSRHYTMSCYGRSCMEKRWKLSDQTMKLSTDLWNQRVTPTMTASYVICCNSEITNLHHDLYSSRYMIQKTTKSDTWWGFWLWSLVGDEVSRRIYPMKNSNNKKKRTVNIPEDRRK